MRAAQNARIGRAAQRGVGVILGAITATDGIFRRTAANWHQNCCLQTHLAAAIDEPLRTRFGKPLHSPPFRTQVSQSAQNPGLATCPGCLLTACYEIEPARASRIPYPTRARNRIQQCRFKQVGTRAGVPGRDQLALCSKPARRTANCQRNARKPLTAHHRHADLAWTPVQSSGAFDWRDGARSGNGSDRSRLRRVRQARRAARFESVWMPDRLCLSIPRHFRHPRRTRGGNQRHMAGAAVHAPPATWMTASV